MDQDNTLTLKARAEGFSVQDIKEVLIRLHSEREHGIHRDDVGDDEVIGRHGLAEFKGGFMYPGWWVRHNTILPGADILETRRSDGSLREAGTTREEWSAAVQSAPVGAVLDLVCQFEGTAEVTLTKFGDDTWERVIFYEWEESRAKAELFSLYEGVRDDVAEELGVEMTSTFHDCFDAAVDSLDSE